MRSRNLTVQFENTLYKYRADCKSFAKISLVKEPDGSI